MIEQKKLLSISKYLSADETDFMTAFRNNVFMYLKDKSLTIKELSERSDVPFSTLNTFLYGSSKDVKLSTAVKLAHSLNVSMDELVGAETIGEPTRESLSICRTLPEHDIYLVRWFIRYLDGLNRNNEPGKRYVSVMELICTSEGNLKLSSNYKKVDISGLDAKCKIKIFFGINLPCDNYMPFYSPYDTLFIANDRPPKPFEHAVIRAGSYLFIAKRKFEKGTTKYYSIRDGKYRLSESDIDELIGYVVCTSSS